MSSGDARAIETSARIVKSDEILGGREEVQIEHNGMFYRLRVTRQDKLILTK
jgi:hemin uptake protein HemP